MKKNNLLFLLAAIFFLGFTASCSDEDPVVYEYIDFEDVSLTDGIWNGSDESGKFVSATATFQNSYTAAYDSWMGFACSSKTDTKTGGWGNQYSVMAGAGANGSKKFALAYEDNATFTFPEPKTIGSAMVTNSTYAYLDMLNGSDYSKKFASGDWFKATFTGYNNDVKSSSVDYYLADFRDGKSVLSKEWAKVDLSSLGTVNKIVITFDSSDKGQWGINTPKYVCIDHIEYY